MLYTRQSVCRSIGLLFVAESQLWRVQKKCNFSTVAGSSNAMDLQLQDIDKFNALHAPERLQEHRAAICCGKPALAGTKKVQLFDCSWQFERDGSTTAGY